MNVRTKRVFEKLKGVLPIVVLAALIALSALMGVCAVPTPAIAAVGALETNGTIYTSADYKPQTLGFKLSEARQKGYYLDYTLDLGNGKVSSPNDSSKSKYISGDFYSDSALPYSKVDGGWSMGDVPKTYMRADLPLGENLKAAIADPMVSVTITSYYRFGGIVIGSDGSPESFKYDIALYYKNAEGKYVSASTVGDTIKGIDGKMNPENIVYGKAANTVPSLAVGDDVYLSICYYDFTVAGQCNIPIAEMGIRVACSSGSVGIGDAEVEILDVVRTSASIEATDNFELNTLRNAAASNDEVRKGNVIIVRNKILHQNAAYAVSQNYNDKNMGYFYRLLYLDPDAKDPEDDSGGGTIAPNTDPTSKLRIFGYSANGSEFKRLYKFSYYCGSGTDRKQIAYDLTEDYSGTMAIFLVSGDRWTSADIGIFLSDANGSENRELAYPITLSFYADNTAADMPKLDEKSSAFAKYIGRSARYYTDAGSYVTETITGSDGKTQEKIVAVDLLKAATSIKPTFTEASYMTKGGDTDSDGRTYKSSQAIYYKVTKLNSLPSSSESTTSKGFDLSEKTGICYTTTAGEWMDAGTAGTITAGDLKLSLVTDKYGRLVYDSETLKEDKELTFHESAIYYIEFMTVDYVGNVRYGDTKYCIKVDVRDYVFDCKMLVGTDGKDNDNQMSQYDVTVTFSTYDDSTGKESASFSKAVFKRGDRVIVRSTLNENTQYILSNFAVGANLSFPITDSGRDVKIKQSGEQYSFEVSSAFSEDPDSRNIVITYKRRVSIEVAGSTAQNVVVNATYTGNSIGVQGRAKKGEEYLTGTNVVTKYSTSLDGTYNTIQPVEAGVYYFRCELSDHDTYYALTTGTLRINPATPVINGINVNPLTYGESLAKIDFDDSRATQVINDHITALNNFDNVDYSDRSSDGIYGYFRLAGLDKNSDVYKKHAATDSFRVTIEFVPIKCKLDANGEEEKDEDGNIIFERENGKFVRNTNYAIATLQYYLTIRRSDSVKIVVDGETDGVITHVYDGTEKALSFSLLSTLAVELNADISEQSFVRYAREGSSSYTDEAPVDAGRYTVFVDLPSGNYTGSWTRTIVIEKKQLLVECKEYTFVFQQQKEPQPTARTGEGNNTQYVNGRKYAFTYYPYDEGKKEDEMAQGEPIGESEYFINLRVPANAGKYLVKIELDEDNYENLDVAYSVVTINKVTANTDGVSLTWPTLTYNSTDRSAHIDYLQPLSNVVLNVASAGLRYTYYTLGADGRVNGRPQLVSGTFYVASRRYRDEDHANESLQSFLDDAVNGSILDIGANQAYIYFVATENDKDNFEPIYTATQVFVGKAKYDFGEVEIEPIVYGKTVSGAQDLTISKTMRYLYTGKGVNVYKTLDADDDVFGYTYSVQMDEPQVFPAGSRYVVITVIPNSPELFDEDTYTYSCLLEIKKKEVDAEIKSELNGEYFEFEYGLDVIPECAFYAYGKDVGALGGTVEYFTEDGDEEAIAPLKVGRYRAVYTVVADNYCGQIEYKVKVIAARLAVSAMPIISEVEKEVSYNKLMSDVRFVNGVMVNSGTNETVDGTFVFDYEAGTRFMDTGVTKAYFMKFIPRDTESYQVYEYTNEANTVRFSMTLTVNKADISDEMSFAVAEKTYGEITFDVNPFSLATYSTSIYYKDELIGGVTVREYSEEAKDGFAYLPISVKVSGLPASGYVNAGRYAVKAEITDDNYYGAATAELYVAKKTVQINVPDGGSKKYYTGQSQNVTNSVISDGKEIRVTVTQSFYRDGQRLNGAPSDIGMYQAVLNVVSNNYQAETLTVDFVIGVDVKNISISPLSQIYGTPRAISVSLGSNRAEFSVYYKSIPAKPDEEAKIFEDLPTDAGDYEVVIKFMALLNNGYSEEITFKDRLHIDRCPVTITVSERVVVDYTGRSYTIRAITTPYGLNLITEYCKEGESEFSTEEILSANTGSNNHLVRFTVDDPNYSGETVVEYVIRPATLTAVATPVFGQTVYRSESQPALIADGRVDFGVQTDVKGKYMLDMDEVSKLSAGTQRVRYTFIALNDDDTENLNFARLTGLTEITVLQQEIPASDFIIGAVSGASREYNGGSFSVDVELKDGVIYNRDTDNSELEIRVYYNDGLNLPRDPGEYTVRAEIFSHNYTGTAVWSQKFIVTKGKPEIAVKPYPRAGKTFKRGDVITDSDLTGGRAVIKGTDTLLEGSFKLQNVRPFEKANYNNVEATFTPTNSFFTPVTFTISVFVEGINKLSGVVSGENWDDESGVGKPITIDGYGTVRVRAYSVNTVYYGEPLSAFRVEFYGDAKAVSYLNGFGALDFVDNTEVLSVGERARVAFTPLGSNADVYSNVYGFVKVDIVKAELPEVNYVLKSIDNEPRLIVTNLDGSLRNDKGTALKLYSDAGFTQPIEDGLASYRNKTVYFKLEMNDYEDLVGSAVPQISSAVSAEQIVVAKTNKPYDGGEIKVTDLGVTVRDLPLGVPVDGDDLYIRVFKDGKEQTGPAASGVYTVVIYLDNELYFGEKEITFTVTKADVSDSLNIGFDRVTYGKFPSNPTVSVNGNVLAAALYTLEYKPATASDSSYTVNKPINAGNYKIRVTIASDNDNYAGCKIFDFTVDKQILRLDAKSEYEYDYGKAEMPIVSFLKADSQDRVTVEREDYRLLFYSATYSISTDMPENAGEYKVRVELDTLNYILGNNGYVEFRYVINKMKVAVTTMPVPTTLTEGGNVYNLKYGQALKELSFTGGAATRFDEPIGGRFTVKEPELHPSVGNNSITVVFMPSNANYATAECEVEIYVAPAEATVYFDRLRVPYIGTGTKQLLSYRVEPEGVRVTVTFVNRRNETVSDPVEAGSYSVKVESADKNYVVGSLLEGNNKIEPVFIVEKAVAETLNMPRTTPISVGDNLSKTTITGGDGYGFVKYENFANPVSGRFSFDESYRTFTTAGNYYLDFTFTPDDSDNFAVKSWKAAAGEGILLVVNKATAQITVSGTTFVYSEGFKLPTFKTEPKEGLKLEHNITWREYDPSAPNYIPNGSDVVDVGSYDFEVWVSETEENYTSGRVRFTLTIQKKVLDMDFTDGDGAVVKQYVMTYGTNAPMGIKLYPNGTDGKNGYQLKDEIIGGVRIDSTYELQYRSTDGETYVSDRAPTDIGSYTVTATLVNNNYTATMTTLYRINTGKIESIEFDEELLERQVYGSVMAPRITTKPAGVSYYIIYQGTGLAVPTDAGSYNMTVYFDDPNYEIRQVSAIFKINKKKIGVSELQVADKIYDGVATLTVSGKLLDINLGDEVYLSLTAATAERDVAVGYHYVDITSYKLSGLQSTNYELIPPVYTRTVYIAPVRVNTPDGNSFITSTTGFNVGTTVEFTKISSAKGGSTFFEKMTGRTSEIIGYSIKENGADTLIDNAFKVYIEIPAEFRDVDFDVTGMGALEGQTIVFSREGDYITFYTTTSGQIVFKKTEFKYGTVVLVSAVAVAVVGIIILLILVPLQHRRKFASDAEKEAVKKIKKGL